MQLQQVCFQDILCFDVQFISLTCYSYSFKKIFLFGPSGKKICYTDKLTKFDKVLLFLSVTQSVSKPYTCKPVRKPARNELALESYQNLTPIRKPARNELALESSPQKS